MKESGMNSQPAAMMKLRMVALQKALFIGALCVGPLLLSSQAADSGYPSKGAHAPELQETIALAMQGNADAQRQLGDMYFDGAISPKDPSKAFKWYLKSARQGDIRAQIDVGRMYKNGIGVETSDLEAIKWFQHATDQGSPAGEFELAVMYDQGRGTAIDHKRAKVLLSKSIAQHYPMAETYAGYMAMKGIGEPANHRLALELFLKAAYADDYEADNFLCSMYLYGEGVARDLVMAYAAGETSRANARDPKLEDQITALLQKITKEMSPAQLIEARQLVTDGKSVGLVNALGARVYKATGKSLLGDSDPVTDLGMGPAFITIDKGGNIYLFKREVGLDDLQKNMVTFFEHSPRPNIRIILSHAQGSAQANQALYAVDQTIKQAEPSTLGSINLMVQQE